VLARPQPSQLLGCRSPGKTPFLGKSPRPNALDLATLGVIRFLAVGEIFLEIVACLGGGSEDVDLEHGHGIGLLQSLCERVQSLLVVQPVGILAVVRKLAGDCPELLRKHEHQGRQEGVFSSDGVLQRDQSLAFQIPGRFPNRFEKIELGRVLVERLNQQLPDDASGWFGVQFG